MVSRSARLPAFLDDGTRLAEQRRERTEARDLGGELVEFRLGGRAVGANRQHDARERHLDRLGERHAASVEVAGGGDGKMTDIELAAGSALVSDDVGTTDQGDERRVGRRRSRVRATAREWFVDRDVEPPRRGCPTVNATGRCLPPRASRGS